VRLEGLSLAGVDPAEATEASLLVRNGALDHVDILEGARGPGLWLPDRATELTGLRVGDRARIGDVEMPVVGVYRDVAGTTVDDYWCSNADLVLLQSRGADLVLPPPLVIVDRATFASLMDDLGTETAEGAWEAPLRDGLTVADTQDLVQQLGCSGDETSVLEWCAGGRPPVRYVNRRDFTREPVMALDAADFVQRFLQSHLPFVTDRSRAIQVSVGGGVWPMAGFAALAGVGLVAAAASLWFDRRRREVTLLTVRGVSPAGLGAKAVLELSIPLVIGGMAGIALAYGAVVWLGPSPVLEPAAVGQAALGGVLGLLGAAATVATVVARRVRAVQGRGRRRVPLGALPWEVALGWVTVVSYQRLGDWGIPVGRGAHVSRVDVWGLLFPVLFLVTAVAVLSRVLALGLRPLRALSRSWPTALYLGVRRVARYRVAVLGLVAASAIAAGVMGYAATMNRSLDATLEAKAKTYVGSDTAIRIASDEPIPPELADRATEVQIHWDAWVEDGRREKASVVVIDPTTFERAAFWDVAFADTSLRDILNRLAAPPQGGRVPAVVVGTDAAVGATAEVGIVEFGTTWFTVEPLTGVSAFPGMQKPKATVFVAASALDGLDLDGERHEAWISGDRDQTLTVLQGAGTSYTEERTRAAVADGASFLTVSWTFGFMQSLGLAAGLLVLGGAAIYLDARRRDRLLGYAFMGRMGLRRDQHRRALVVELTASVVVGCWMGLGVALAAAWLAHERIDPVPAYRPDPLLRAAVAVVAALAVTSVIIAATAAVLAQRRTDRDDPVEVMRAGV
jgi:putative ABC transport system permease protein